MCKRAHTREAFGGKLAEKQFVQDFVAKSRIEIDGARWMVLNAAWQMDEYGKREARQAISMTKVVAANVVMDVLDRAIQVHGALGVSDDTPLADHVAPAAHAAARRRPRRGAQDGDRDARDEPLGERPVARELRRPGGAAAPASVAPDGGTITRQSDARSPTSSRTS